MTFVYRLPGPIIIASASFIVSNTPGAGTQFEGFIYILSILAIFSNTVSAILSFSSTIVPSFNSAHIFYTVNLALSKNWNNISNVCNFIKKSFFVFKIIL